VSALLWWVMLCCWCGLIQHRNCVAAFTRLSQVCD
jgi:hypothetical protein